MWNVGEKGVRIPSVPGFEIRVPEIFANSLQVHWPGPQQIKNLFDRLVGSFDD